jgi:3-mercaptopyruvate sulfurtransferase SseA
MAVCMMMAASVIILIGSRHVEGQQRVRAGAREPGVRPEMLVSSAQLAGQLQGGQVIALHVARERAHYDKAHIPGAANVFWMGNVESKENPVLLPPAELRRLYASAGVAPARKVVTYCRTGGQAAHAYFTLKYLGYDVTMYDGSFFEWSQTEGAPVVTGGARK